MKLSIKIFIVLSITLLLVSCYYLWHSSIGEEVKEEVTLVANNLNYLEEIKEMSPSEGLGEALDYFDIKEPYIVYAQAILETGNFNSRLCTEDNNLFGLYDSKNKQYFKYNHWVESVEAYKKYIQSKYKQGDYYIFLKNIVYATDEHYIDKLKRIVNELEQYDLA